MKNLEEKEKKLQSALSKLKTLKLNFDDLSANISNIENQKNQLKIEKEELQQKYINLNSEHQNLKHKLEKVNLETVEMDFDEDELLKYMQLAHEQGLSLNEFIEKALEQAMGKSDFEKECG